MANKTATSRGTGFFGLLTIAFIVLKLCKVINWSWLWVLSPLWIPIAIVLAVVIIGGTWQLYKSKRKKAIIRKVYNNHPEFKKMIEGEDLFTKSKWQQRMEAVQKQQSERN